MLKTMIKLPFIINVKNNKILCVFTCAIKGEKFDGISDLCAEILLSPSINMDEYLANKNFLYDESKGKRFMIFGNGAFWSIFRI